jgi:hypothetical protein
MTNDPKPDCAEYWFAGVFGGIVRPSPFDPGLESGATAGPNGMANQMKRVLSEVR